MDRRNFLKTLALSGAAIAIKPSGSMDVMAQTTRNSKSGATNLVAVMGGEPDEMFRSAIKELGGMKKFVKKGMKIVVKPNIGWNKTPELAANTNPILVGEIVKQCLDAGASEVIVFDHTCDDWKRTYVTSGIEDAVKAAGGKMMPAHEESYYRDVTLPEGVKLKSTKVHQAIIDCDGWINVPVLKHHGGANLSISMKNYMGIVWDRRYFHNNDLQQCIADSCTYAKRPMLNVVDAYRVVKDHGPQGRSENDVVTSKSLFVSPDIVAVDTAATKFFGQIREMPVESVGHLANGEKLNLGTTDIDKLNIKRIKL